MTDGQNREIDYLRISVTDRCNLRCVYCMPKDGITSVPHNELLSYEEIERICRCAAEIGIRKVKLTGGEPLTRRGLTELVRSIKALPKIEQVTITSNGILLYEQLPGLVEAGLDAVNISLDTLDEKRFELITRSKGLNLVLKAIDRAVELGLRVKINCLPEKEYNGDHLMQIAELAHNRPIDVRFIELMPIGLGKTLTPVSNNEIRRQLEESYGTLTPYEQVRGNGPAVYASPQGFQGKIGFISAVSDAFCSSCNRIRLTSTGFLKLCLHSDSGVNLRKPLRDGISDENLKKMLCESISKKPKSHHFGNEVPNEDRRIMSQIGG
ncbi:MAG: GTP 3',8-cyclase MoaA [Hydrogenoanaerobacterium sp.]